MPKSMINRKYCLYCHLPPISSASFLDSRTKGAMNDQYFDFVISLFERDLTILAIYAVLIGENKTLVFSQGCTGILLIGFLEHPV